MLAQDPNYNKGFKFDHVWNILKNFEKFVDNVPTARQRSQQHTPSNYVSSESENPTPEFQTPESPGLSSFATHLNDVPAGTSSQRPIGVKKAKTKRKKDSEFDDVVKRLSDDNVKLMAMLEHSREDRQKQMEMQEKQMEMQKQHITLQEDRILLRDLNSISNPTIRAHIEARQLEILEKRAVERQQPFFPNFDYLNNPGGSGSGGNLGDY